MPIASLANLELFYEVDGADTDAPAVVLIAGAGQGHRFWREIVPSLARDRRVVTFDNRGYGQSALPELPYTIEMMAADTLELIEALGLERPHVVGHSMGAAIAFELGRVHPSKVGRVCLMSALYPGPAMILPTRRALKVMTRREGDPLELAEQSIRISTAPGFEARCPAMFARLIEEAVQNVQPAEAYQRQTRAASAYLTSDKLEQGFAPPLCLIYGEQDELTRPVTAEVIKTRVPHAEVHLLAETGHLPPLERPEAVAEILERFLRA